jgi:hypothetical protein
VVAAAIWRLAHAARQLPRAQRVSALLAKLGGPHQARERIAR